MRLIGWIANATGLSIDSAQATMGVLPMTLSRPVAVNRYRRRLATQTLCTARLRGMLMVDNHHRM